MRETTPAKDWVRMRENVRRAVKALEVCWRCQKVSECQKYVLGNMVLVWLCKPCLANLEEPRPGESDIPDGSPLFPAASRRERP